MTNKINLNSLTHRAIYFSILNALILSILKIFFGLASGSVAIFASALDSIFDLFTSCINLFALKVANNPADGEHRYGHGKAEALATIIQSLFIFAIGIYLFYRGIIRVYNPLVIVKLNSGMAIMGFSLLSTVALVFYQKYVINKTASLVVRVDSLHYITDIFTNLVVIVTLLSTKYLQIYWLDGITGILLAIYILYASFIIFLKGQEVLMDTDQSHKYRPGLIQILNKYQNVLGYHDLRSRTAGNTTFLEFHLEMYSHLTLKNSHATVENIMKDLRKSNKDNCLLDISIHVDPVIIHGDNEKKILDEKPPKFY